MRDIDADTETVAELVFATVSILVAIAVIVFACLAMMQPAYAADPTIAAPASCLAWIIPAIGVGGIVGGLVVALFAIAHAVRPIGNDAAEHDANMTAAMRAESLTGGDK